LDSGLTKETMPFGVEMGLPTAAWAARRSSEVRRAKIEGMVYIIYELIGMSPVFESSV